MFCGKLWVLQRVAFANVEQTGGIPNTFFFSQPHTSEGIRFEIRPTTTARDDDLEVLKILQKHVKIENNTNVNTQPNTPPKPNAVHSTLISTYPDMELIYSPKQEKAKLPTKESKKLFKSNEDIEKENGLIFALSKGKRNLLSTDFKRTNDFNDLKETTDDWSANTERNASAFDEFIETFNVKKYNETKEKALSQYLEKVKQKNIRIYSSAHPVIGNFTSTISYIENPSTMPNYNVLFEKNVDSKSNLSLNDTIVTISKSEIKVDEYTGDMFEGKILLTVENPEIGTEHIDIHFDVPLIINFNDDIAMNDSSNFRSNDGQFEMTAGTYMEQGDQNEKDIETNTEPEQNENIKKKSSRKRFKRGVKSADKPPQDIMSVSEIPLNTPTNITSNSSINYNLTVKNPFRLNNTESDNMTISDFFMMISDWFKALEGVKVDKPKDKSGSDLTELLIQMSNSSTVKNVTDTAYPSYDSDMIENIGHRSRVLLSVENFANATEEKKEMANANVTRAKRADGSGGNVSTTANSTTLTSIKSNVTTPKKNADTKIKDTKLNNKTKAKTVYKRNADESNLIFWNDMYDDEYGIQTDKLDNAFRDRHSVKQSDFIKRSGRWVHDKIKKFAANLKINPRTPDSEIKERVPRDVKNPGIGTYPKYIYDKISDRIGRRDSDEKEEEDYDIEQKSIFTALSANMKEVCKKAARAVQQTRNIEVRENTKQGSIATTLMQQLVRLLTDLVDYQVQQKTCTKLPADLQSFLEWLTFPKEEAPDAQSETLTFKTPFQEEDLIEELEMQNSDDQQTDRNQDFATQPPNEKQGQGQGTDLRLHYVEALHSIQDLLEQFEEMSDDEKSKMTGVKSYLENQLRYLNKQLSGYDLFTIFEKHNRRYKRDLRRKKMHPLKRKRRRLSKFLKNFGKKHTRTTASYYDGIQVTEMKRNTDKSDDKIEIKINQAFDDKISHDVKRNLIDVYYKAIAEAKKYATGKGMHKKEEDTHFGSTTVETRQ